MIGDFTDNNNPSLYAYQAQNIDKKHREDIVDIILQYDNDFDTPLDRTKESLITEWEGHHEVSAFSKRAQDIDFDNAEEDYNIWDYRKKAIDAGVDIVINKVKDIFNKFKSLF